MVNEDILTSLRNSVERGTSLEEAKMILKNSGYNLVEIEEASKYVGEKAPLKEAKPKMELTMPEEKKGFFSKMFGKKPAESKKSSPDKTTEQTAEDIKKEVTKPPAQPTQGQPSQTPQIQPTQAKLTSSEPLTKELKKMSPKKPGHMKEIILLVVLIALIGILTMTFLFRDKLLNLFP